MKRSVLAAGLLSFCFACCADSARADEIRVAVAANFSSAMEGLAQRFQASTGHTVLASTGSTGGHYAQIRNGAPFEAFFAADVARPKLLEDQKIAIAGSRFTYAVGRIVLWSRQPGLVDAAGRVLEQEGFRHLAIANPELAPYGAAAREVLEHRGLWQRLQGRLVMGQDIGQTYSFVFTGSAELGFVALSQVSRPNRAIEGSYWVVPQDLYSPIEQQAVLLKDVPAARQFLDFVKSDEAKALIESFGYGVQ